MKDIMMRLVKYFLTGFLTSQFILAGSLYADEVTEQEAERWLNSDDLNPPNYKKTEVNGGTFTFLDNKPVKPVHHHHNVLTILKSSLQDGWVKLEQCHRNLDRVEFAQVTFNENRVRDIKVTRALHIARAWVEGNTVQLENVTDKAILCIAAWTKALEKSSDGYYYLSNGPYMRKYLDGYFPIHVSIDINFQATNLKLLQFEPKAQSGFKVTQTTKSISMDAWFEGRLKTRLTFVKE